MTYRAITGCRVCGTTVVPVLNLGQQLPQGQFVAGGALRLPPAPLELTRCPSCTLVQLRHSYDPASLFSDYWYRSSVTATMRQHLHDLASAAMQFWSAHNKGVPAVLDVGCNDGTLLGYFTDARAKVGFDPANVATGDGFDLRRELFPPAKPIAEKFDIVTSVACFYDIENPIGFAEAVGKLLAPGGVWILEVADLAAMLRNVGFDAICFEHLEYYSPAALHFIAGAAGLRIVEMTRNDCNGGSLRCYLQKYEDSYWNTSCLLMDSPTPLELQKFANDVDAAKTALLKFLTTCAKPVHLLGASTKANTLLQYCGIDSTLVEYASERDHRKHGLTTATGIPIVSEEESRSRKPAYYLVGPWHFRRELLQREETAIRNGTHFIFPLPTVDVV